MTQVFYREVPSQVAARRFVDDLTNLMFPIRAKKSMSIKEIDLRWENLQQDLISIVSPLCECEKCDPQVLSEQFFSEIPLIYTRLMQDAAMYKSCDPAVHCTEEVILCYPGFYAVMVYRLSHVLYGLNIPILPRVISEYAHSQTGIDIHPGATIGHDFYIDHGTGIVIGETTVIGRNVKIYQGVTPGATFVEHDTVIGGNVWLTESVPPHSTVYHKPEIIIKGKRQK